MSDTLKSFPLSCLDAPEKPSRLLLEGVGLLFSLAAPRGRALGWGCLGIQGSAPLYPVT